MAALDELSETAADGERKSHGARLDAATIGFALYWVWLWAVNRSPLTVLAHADGGGASLTHCISPIASVVVLLVASALCSTQRRFELVLLVSTLFGTLGMMVIGPMTIALPSVEASKTIHYAGNVLTGVGEGGCIFAWAAWLSSMPSNSQRIYELALSALIASLLYLICNYLEVGFFALLVTLLLPVSVLLFWSQRNCYEGLRKERAAQPRQAKLTLGRVYASLVVFGCAFGLILSISLLGERYLFINRASFGFAALFFLIAIVVSRRGSNSDIFALYKIAAPLTIIGYAFFPLNAFGNSPVFPSVVISVGWRLFDVTIILVILDIADRLMLLPLRTFGISRACVILGISIGRIVGFLLTGTQSLAPYQFIVISAVAVTALTVVNVVFLDFEGIERVRFYFDGKQKNDSDTAVEQVASPRTLEMVCHDVALRYGLSRREEEVLLLLARGRDAKYIENALFISNATVKTRRHNIYQKLDVHSRQELLNIIERT